MLLIKSNSSFSEEKKYILDVIFNEFIGLRFNFIVDESQEGIEIHLKNGSKLLIMASLFKSNQDYLALKSIPKVVTFSKNIFIPEQDIPVLFGQDRIDIGPNHICCHIDIFATCFFMLTRMEEVIVKDRDSHNRFSGKSSLAFKNGFLERPIVDEYTEMLTQILFHLDPQIQPRKNKATIFVTCDLDWPFDPIRRSLQKTIVKSVADIIKRKSIKDAVLSWKYYVFHTLGIKQSDFYRDTIDWIMNENERVGNKVAFYFIAKATSNLDTNFDIFSKEMQTLLKSIHNRGHQIGLHPGYNCFNSSENFEKSYNNLVAALDYANISGQCVGGRMHYLRWDALETPQLWEKCGFEYDSTLSFADCSGFRCGSSKEFTMFDLNAKVSLRLKQRPLINMECTIISSGYENFGYSDEALIRFKKFKKLSYKYSGTYTLLWHNGHLKNELDKCFYKELIKY